MEIAFESESLRQLCENRAAAIYSLGGEIAETLRHRLSDVQAAPSLPDIVWGNRRTEGKGRKQCMLIDLSDECHLVISPNHVRNPTTPDGDPDWSAITRAKVICIRMNSE